MGGPATLKFSPYGSGGNSSKVTGSGFKSDSDFYHDPPREGLGVYFGRLACDRTREGNPAKVK
jgi:hypothetical protein